MYSELLKTLIRRDSKRLYSLFDSLSLSPSNVATIFNSIDSFKKNWYTYKFNKRLEREKKKSKKREREREKNVYESVCTNTTVNMNLIIR